MKTSLYEIKKLVSEVLLSEAKKKKEKAEKLKYAAKPGAYSYDESFDFSAALGAYNLYRSQGATNWGPMTGPGTKIDDRILGQRASSEAALRGVVKEAIREQVKGNPSPWVKANQMVEQKLSENVWEAALQVLGKK